MRGGLTHRITLFLTMLLVPVGAVAGLFSNPIIDAEDPLENTGSFAVKKQPTELIVEQDILAAELFIPQGDIYGFVLFMPGFGTSFKSYDDYLTHLASHVYLSVGIDFNSAAFTTESEHDLKAKQALGVIETVQNMDVAYASLPVFVAGHSQGGKLAFFAAAIDTENTISGVLALDPVNSGGPPCFIFPNQCTKYPVAPNIKTQQRGILHQMNAMTSSIIFRSQPDPFTNPEEQFNAERFYYGTDGQGLDAAPSPSWYYDFGRFSHTSYVPLFCSEEVQIIKRSMVAFLQQEAQGIDRTEYLTGVRIQRDVKAGYLDKVVSR